MSERWHLEGGEVFDSDRRGVALISTTYLGKGAGPLIAAAPELLEALKNATFALALIAQADGNEDNLKAARAAIAKASADNGTVSE